MRRTAAWRWATVAAVWPRIRGGSRNPLSLIVRAAVFLSVSVLSLLILDHETVRSIARPLDHHRKVPPGTPAWDRCRMEKHGNRCFPAKAVAVWHQLDDRGRVRLVERYLLGESMGLHTEER